MNVGEKKGTLIGLLGPLIFLLINTRALPQDSAANWVSEVAELGDKRCDFTPNGVAAPLFPSYYEPKKLSDQQKVAFLIRGLKTEKSLKRKLVCLKILVERFPLTTYRKIESIATNGSYDLEIRKRAIWVTGIMRHPQAIGWLEKLLDDMEPSIRTAAIDALGFCLFPHFTEKFHANNFSDPYGVSINGPVRIFVNNAYRFNVVEFETLAKLSELAAAQRLAGTGVGKNTPLRKFDDDEARKRIVAKLLRTMTRARTQMERIAAARALAGYQPKEYRLRVAEWGVWVDSGGELELAKSVLDEIPPIAYQTTKQVSELKKRINQIMIITKPIIHLKVDRPMSVGINAFLRSGQVWYSYPQPNDFALKVSNRPRTQEVADSDFQKFKKTASSTSDKWKPFGEQAHEGYPFLLPKAPMIGGYSGRGFGGSMNLIEALGVRWQHLIVTPKQQNWMFEQSVEEQYRWWSDLRKVNSAWVSNGFESERFLYYDGPTNLPSPVVIERSEEKKSELMFHYFGVLQKQASDIDIKKQLTEPVGLVIEVKDGKVTSQEIAFDYVLKSTPALEQRKKKLNLSDVNHLLARYSGSESHGLNERKTKQALLQMLKLKNGLQEDEAQGLIDAWSNQFLKTEGRRLIVRLRRQDYDFQCPLEVTPVPTELARVGLILIEL